MKRLVLILIASLTITSASSQDANKSNSSYEIFIKGSFGTSWIILPKVFLIDIEDTTTNAQVLPAINGVTGTLGVQAVFHLSNGWVFAPEVNLTYIGGEVRVNRTAIVDNVPESINVQNLQSYVRAEIPLHFGVRSNDDFWVTLGPSLYFTLYDNNGFDNAVNEGAIDPSNPPKVNSANPIGVRFRLAAYAPVGQRSYIDVKFESDLGQKFDYVNDTYEVKFSLQNLSIGYGYRLSK